MNLETSSFIKTHRQPREIPYQKCATAVEVLRMSQLPYLPIVGIPIPFQEMYKEAQALIPRMVPHRTDYEDNPGWKSLVLHGLASDKTQGAEQYGLDPEDRSLYHWTDVADLCPITTQFFKEQFKYDMYQRIRFMLLEPGGYVSPHTDTDQYRLGPVNIALNNPDGCEFVMENVGVVPFKAGTIMKLALINRHSVFNNSNEPRIHMIVHGAPHFNSWQDIFLNSYRALLESDSRFLAR